MNGRGLRVRGEFTALVDYKDAGMGVKVPRARVDELVASGVGRPSGPAGKVFREWVALPIVDTDTWRAVLREALAYAARAP